jgi:hypothetical protein
MSYRSNPFRKDNPRWVISNAAETTKVPCVPSPGSPLVTAVTWDQPEADSGSIGGGARAFAGIVLSWLIGLPRRAGARLFDMNDQEAGWRGWQVTETWGGLGRQYRDPRFDALRLDPTLRRPELQAELQAELDEDTSPPVQSPGGV